MKRIITSFKNANKHLLRYISEEFPQGVEDDALINFPKVGGGFVRALEIVMDDVNYLVKMENEEYFQRYLAQEDDEDDEDDDLELESENEGDEIEEDFDED